MNLKKQNGLVWSGLSTNWFSFPVWSGLFGSGLVWMGMLCHRDLDKTGLSLLPGTVCAVIPGWVFVVGHS